jgi:hypothetical protein
MKSALQRWNCSQYAEDFSIQSIMEWATSFGEYFNVQFNFSEYRTTEATLLQHVSLKSPLTSLTSNSKVIELQTKTSEHVSICVFFLI